jgi:hypothetical protein
MMTRSNVLEQDYMSRPTDNHLQLPLPREKHLSTYLRSVSDTHTHFDAYSLS